MVAKMLVVHGLKI
jgi:hypothetical protein